LSFRDVARTAESLPIYSALKGRRTQKRLTETADLLQTLTALGQAEELPGERFTAV
jgi:hypothetical protein